MFVYSRHSLRCPLLILFSFQDPNDPTTFPGYRPGAETLAPPGQVPITGAGNTLADVQTARPGEYHGLPTV